MFDLQSCHCPLPRHCNFVGHGPAFPKPRWPLTLDLKVAPAVAAAPILYVQDRLSPKKANGHRHLTYQVAAAAPRSGSIARQKRAVSLKAAAASLRGSFVNGGASAPSKAGRPRPLLDKAGGLGRAKLPRRKSVAVSLQARDQGGQPALGAQSCRGKGEQPHFRRSSVRDRPRLVASP